MYEVAIKIYRDYFTQNVVIVVKLSVLVFISRYCITNLKIMSTNSEIHTYYRYAFYYIDMFHIKLAEIFDIAHSKHKITRGSLMC